MTRFFNAQTYHPLTTLGAVYHALAEFDKTRHLPFELFGMPQVVCIKGGDESA